MVSPPPSLLVPQAQVYSLQMQLAGVQGGSTEEMGMEALAVHAQLKAQVG